MLGKDRCAGCLGLALGCAISFIAMAAYLLLPNVDAGMAPLLVLFGLSAVAACFVEVAWHPSGPWWHVLSNLLLPVGFLLVTIGVMEVASGTAFGLLAVLMSFLWLDTRVQLSEWRNARVCETCGQLCKSY